MRPGAETFPSDSLQDPSGPGARVRAGTRPHPVVGVQGNAPGV